MNKKSEAIQKPERNIVDVVSSRIRGMIGRGQLDLPADYSAENALKSAWLVLQGVQTKDSQPVLSACTPESISNALLDMVVQGLNPLKKQCAFIAYGKTLTLQRQYQGTIALLRRVYPGTPEPVAQTVYEGDEFSYRIEGGRKVIDKHVQTLASVAVGKLVGAYCVVEIPDRPPHVEVMTIAQIEAAWKQRQGKGLTDAHRNFPDRMAEKTVINRACWRLICASDDSYLVRAASRSNVDATLAEMDELEEAEANRLEIGPAVSRTEAQGAYESALDRVREKGAGELDEQQEEADLTAEEIPF